MSHLHSPLPILSLDPLPETSLPTSSESSEPFLHAYLQSAQRLLASFPNAEADWKQGKSHVDETVENWTRQVGSENQHRRPRRSSLGAPQGEGEEESMVLKPGEHWCARRSWHEEEKYADFKEGLFTNHAVNESQYIPTLMETLLLHPLTLTPPSSTPPVNSSVPFLANVYRLHYKLSGPLSPRTFIVLLIQQETIPGAEFINIQVPVSMANVVEGAGEEKGRVRGKYVSVERVKKVQGKGLEWTMMTASTPGGSIPQFLVDRSLPGEIAKDVPLFLNWIHRRNEGILQLPSPNA